MCRITIPDAIVGNEGADNLTSKVTCSNDYQLRTHISMQPFVLTYKTGDIIDTNTLRKIKTIRSRKRTEQWRKNNPSRSASLGFPRGLFVCLFYWREVQDWRFPGADPRTSSSVRLSKVER